MIRLARRAAILLGVVTVAASCAGLGSGSASNATPAQLWSIFPSQADVRSTMGDSNWFEGPPSFEVDPLDAGMRQAAEKFSVSQSYEHLGSGEEIVARYTLFDKTSSATTRMTDYQTLYGQSISTSPKVGDQVLYYDSFGSGGAPYTIRTFVRVGQVVLTLIWSKRDTNIKVSDLGRRAQLFANQLRNLGKSRVQADKVDPNFLPPAGLDITELGSAVLPLDSFVVMYGAALPGTTLGSLQGAGATSFAYGDYALNLDTHMEVQTAVLRFPTSSTASDFATVFSPSPADQNGIGSGYIPTGGTPAAGVYHYVFSAGPFGVMMICKPSIDGEAASRECEDPMEKTAIAWKDALGKVS